MNSRQMIFVGILVVAASILVFAQFSTIQGEDEAIAKRDLTRTDETASNGTVSNGTASNGDETDGAAENGGNGEETNGTASNGTASNGDEMAAASAQHGEELFRNVGCTACHSVDGSRVLGPSMLGLWGSERTFEDGTTATADAEYIHQSIREPNAHIVEGFPAVMTAFGESQLSDDDINDIIAYIQSLSE